MHEDIMPCPWCGKVGTLKDCGKTGTSTGIVSYSYVQCTNPYCPVQPCTFCEPTEEEAIAKWNTRF